MNNEKKFYIFQKFLVEIKINTKKRKNFQLGFHIFKKKQLIRYLSAKRNNFGDFDSKLALNP
jgi:hypothetical protein